MSILPRALAVFACGLVISAPAYLITGHLTAVNVIITACAMAGVAKALRPR